MQQRRYRPGDVLDDYCPRERRITDHAIVAMIDDHIKQTRCVVCDAEHEYKDGKVPSQRRKKPKAALFAQVLEGLNGPQPPARVATHATPPAEPQLVDEPIDDVVPPPVIDAPVVMTRQIPRARHERRDAVAALEIEADARPTDAGRITDEEVPPAQREEGPWRRQLIRAALPRPEGQQPPPSRPVPEFTIRQPNSARGRHGRRRGGFAAPSGNGNNAPARFGRSAQREGQGGRRRRGRGGKKNN
jgi:hypothetical protein